MKNNQKEKNIERLPYEDWEDLAFNATTNFSLLGFILDWFRKNNNDKSKVDMNFDE
jgi:hypothetical protein